MSTPKKRRSFYFTPELEKQFNLVTVPGTNVSSNVTVGENARKTGVQTLNFLAQEAARKDAEIESRSDRKTVKRLTTVGERLRGDNGYSSYMSGGTGMSGRDPLLGTIFDWTVGAKGIDALGKTALWNFAKYGPSNLFRGLARNYFINNAFKLELRKPILFGAGETLQPQVRTRVGDVEIDNPGLKFTIEGKTFANDFGGRRIPAEGLILNTSNTTAYTWNPGYGYKLIVEEPSTSLKFLKEKFQKQTLEDLKLYVKNGYLIPKRENISKNSTNVIPKVNWDANNWFQTISGRNSYSAEEAIELASHIPEYRAIEQRLFNEGKLALNSNGDIVVVGSEMSPQEYIMRLSKAFQKMNPEHHYTGVPKQYMDDFEARTNVESWTDRISPKNVEEYAFGNFKKRKLILDNIKYLEDLEKQQGVTESTLDWLKIYKEKLKLFDSKIELMKQKNLGKVYDITYSKDLNAYNIDAQGNHWAHIPVELVEKSGYPKKYLRVKEMATDDIVGGITEYNPSIVNINNVMDTYDGTLLNETIIPKTFPKKSVLGNTGSFDLEGPNRWRLYRGLIPLTTGYSLYNILSQPQLQYLKQGGKLTINNTDI